MMEKTEKERLSRRRRRHRRRRFINRGRLMPIGWILLLVAFLLFAGEIWKREQGKGALPEPVALSWEPSLEEETEEEGPFFSAPRYRYRSFDETGREIIVEPSVEAGRPGVIAGRGDTEYARNGALYWVDARGPGVTARTGAVLGEASRLSARGEDSEMLFPSPVVLARGESYVATTLPAGSGFAEDELIDRFNHVLKRARRQLPATAKAEVEARRLASDPRIAAIGVELGLDRPALEHLITEYLRLSRIPREVESSRLPTAEPVAVVPSVSSREPEPPMERKKLLPE